MAACRPYSLSVGLESASHPNPSHRPYYTARLFLTRKWKVYTDSCQPCNFGRQELWRSNLQDERRAGRWLRLSVLILLSLLASVPSLFGSPIACGQTTLSDLLSQGACTIGDYTLTDFTFSSSGTGDINLVSASDIIVDTTASTPTDLSVQFSTSGGFQAADGQTAEYIVHFNLDPLFPTIAGPVLDLGPYDPVTLTGEFCGDGTLVSAPNAQPVMCTGSAQTGIFPARVQIAGTGSSSPTFQGYQFPSAVTTMDTRLILDLTGPANASYFGIGVNVTPVPEPRTAALFLIPALLALVSFRKKRPAAAL
jgi:hypothetical protein